MNREVEARVLVVGAGPAGLATAAALARHGVDVIVVERRERRSALPKATVISTRTMEIVRSWGLEEPVRAGAVEVDWLMWRCMTLAEAGQGVGVEVGLPTRSQARLISPTAPVCAPQPHLEGVLLDYLSSFELVRVELGSELLRVDTDADGVRAYLRSPSGRKRIVRAEYVVGADGVRSVVRAALGIRMMGPPEVLAGATSLIRAPLWDHLPDHRYGIYAVNHPLAESIFLPAGPDDRWGFGYFVEPGAAPPTPQVLVDRVRLAAGIPELPVRIERIGTFTSGAQMAERFRHGRAFLVGDAAHRVTPRGGTGMNTAIHDGYDLGWKLAWVLEGWAPASLLDTYEAERRPVAAHNVARSADPDGSARPAGEELRVDLGGRIAHHWVAGAAGPYSTLDLVGPGLTLFTGPHGHHWGDVLTRVASRVPVTLHPIDELTARALGVAERGALLVRPDGVPAGLLAGGADAHETLQRAVDGSTRPTGAAWRQAA